ncbi:MAG: hypothetical protein AB1498_07565 [bacterium]
MKENSLKKNYSLLKKHSKNAGTVLFGVADISKLKEDFIFEDRSVLDNLNYAVSIGMPLLAGVLETIRDKPTPLYFHHYRQTNNVLDKLTNEISHFIQNKGFKAIPIPASQIIDWKRQLAQVSHRVIAYNAGLGWWGRNNLLVNPVYGSKARYATILTDFPLQADGPLKNGCGVCVKCISVCPTNAINKDSRNFKREDCLEKLKEFARIPGIGQFICGICVKVCDGKSKIQNSKFRNKVLYGKRNK